MSVLLAGDAVPRAPRRPVLIFALAAAALVAVATSGCARLDEEDYMRAPREYRCTQRQALRVALEARDCIELTHVIGSFCYGSAIIRICTPISSEIPSCAWEAEQRERSEAPTAAAGRQEERR